LVTCSGEANQFNSYSDLGIEVLQLSRDELADVENAGGHADDVDPGKDSIGTNAREDKVCDSQAGTSWLLPAFLSFDKRPLSVTDFSTELG
jgi:hypothetical protein